MSDEILDELNGEETEPKERSYVERLTDALTYGVYKEWLKMYDSEAVSYEAEQQFLECAEMAMIRKALFDKQAEDKPLECMMRMYYLAGNEEGMKAVQNQLDAIELQQFHDENLTQVLNNGS